MIISETQQQNILAPKVSRTKVFKKFWKMCIGELSSLADLMLLLLGLLLSGNALHLSCSPPLCSIGCRFHPILLEILLNVKHIARQLNPSKKLFKVIIHLNDHPRVIWVGNILLRIKV